MSSLASIDAIRRKDLVQWHRQFFSPRNLWIAVSGDMSREEAENALERHFGTWPPRRPRHGNAPAVPQRRGIRLIPKETSQSIVIVGHPAPPKGARIRPPSKFSIFLGSGGFFSRIFQEVRTDRGLAYSTGSFYRSRRTTDFSVPMPLPEQRLPYRFCRCSKKSSGRAERHLHGERPEAGQGFPAQQLPLFIPVVRTDRQEPAFRRIRRPSRRLFRDLPGTDPPRHARRS